MDAPSGTPPNTAETITPLSMEQVDVIELDKISPTLLTADSCICIPTA
ncbi:MAG: hypothetical protein PHE06_01070 [Lachnospiraceae bacterium]|nr:hypothetical protein [Lachnospiraceae bacterium]MDD3794559.1 hypothetical protein [Lachnospiraceae bacterium]